MGLSILKISFSKNKHLQINYRNYKHHNEYSFNPLMPGGNKKVTHTETNLQLLGAGLFKFV